MARVSEAQSLHEQRAEQRLIEIRQFADEDLLDLVTPVEMYGFLDVLEAARAWREESWVCECEATNSDWRDLVDLLRGNMEKALNHLEAILGD